MSKRQISLSQRQFRQAADMAATHLLFESSVGYALFACVLMPLRSSLAGAGLASWPDLAIFKTAAAARKALAS